MGLFDTFIVTDFKCPRCGHLHEENELQTKDFESSLDCIRIGEDVREKVETWFLHDGNMLTGKHKLTQKQAMALARRYPHKYKMSDPDPIDNCWALYKYVGTRSRNFSHIRYATFELHGGCDKCDEYLSVTGYIEDYIFKGIK